MTVTRVIVTRPLREAVGWVASLRERGFDAVALPLIDIVPLAKPDDIEPARQRLSGYAAAMFVSAAAAEFFFPADASRVAAMLGGTTPRFWATGPGTARALQARGVPAESVDLPPSDAERLDSEALWPVVRAQVRPGSRILFVRGGDARGLPTGRDWLEKQVSAAGGACDAVVAYRRCAPRWTAASESLARAAANDGAVWVFSSSEAVANLCAGMASIDWRRARAVATHPRIAQAVHDAGFGLVRAAAPGVDALVASIESFG